MQANAAPKAGGSYTMLIMLALIFVVMWLFMIRPQKKNRKNWTSFGQSKKGDKIITVGGIYGTVDEVKENKILIEIDKDVKIFVDKSSIVKDPSA